MKVDQSLYGGLRIEKNGRSGGIRTHDPLTPSQVRYRAALRSEPRKPLYNQRLERKREIASAILQLTSLRDRLLALLEP